VIARLHPRSIIANRYLRRRRPIIVPLTALLLILAVIYAPGSDDGLPPPHSPLCLPRTVYHMMLKRLVDAVPLWLAVGIPVLACCIAMPSESKVACRPDAGLPVELIPGEYRGPTAEEVIASFNGVDPGSVMLPDEME
jgi:hypothetical protein